MKVSAETEETNTNEDDAELRSELLQDVPAWLQNFMENLVDKNVQPHQHSPSSSHEIPMESRANEKWWPDSMECYGHLRNIQDRLSDGMTPEERRFGMPFTESVIPFGAMVDYHPVSAEDKSRLHQFGPKVLPGMFLGYALYAGGIWKGDVLVADLEELETMDASEIYSKRLSAKEVIFPKRAEFIFPNADGRIKNPWKRSGPENIHFGTASTNSRRE